MVISSCQMIGYMAGIATLVGTILTTALPDWKHNNLADESFGDFRISRGLWIWCTVKQNGAIECKPIAEPFFLLTTVLRGCRTLSVLASIIAFFGVFTTPLGMQCTRIGGDQVTKARLARLGAVLFCLAGICVGAAVSWFADDVAREFTKTTGDKSWESISGIKYVYGNALFIGWGTMIMGFISGIFIVCGSFLGRVRRPRNSFVVSTDSESRALTNCDRTAKIFKSYTSLRSNSKLPTPQNNYLSTSVTNNGGSGSRQGEYVTSTLAAPSSERQGGLIRKTSSLSLSGKLSVPKSKQHAVKTYV